jgi:hypothetical protein
MSGFGLFYTLTSIFHQTVHIPIPTSAPTLSPTFTTHTTNAPADPGAVQQFSGPATFNLDYTIDNNYGPKDWNKVTCENIKSCVSSK